MTTSKTPKKKRCDSVAGIREIAENLQTKIESPIPLTDEEQATFDRIIQTLPVDCWDSYRIELAASLAQMQIQSRALKERVDNEGITVEAAQGPKVNPAFTAYNQLIGRIAQMTGTLGLSANKQGINGTDLGRRKEAEKTIRGAMEKAKGNSLLA